MPLRIGPAFGVAGALLISLVYHLVIVSIVVAKSGGEAGGDSGPYSSAGAGDLHLSLEVGCNISENGSPGFLWGTWKGRQRQFAYICVVRHRYTGDPADEFPLHVRVADGKGVIEQSLKIGTSSFRIKWSAKHDEIDSTVVNESLMVCAGTVDPKEGRLFVVDMRDKDVSVDHVDYSLPVPFTLRNAIRLEEQIRFVWKDMRRLESRGRVARLDIHCAKRDYDILSGASHGDGPTTSEP